jgi:hypothetical protein
MEPTIDRAIQAVIEGRFEPADYGQYSYMAHGGSSFVADESLVDAETLELVKEREQEILDGLFRVNINDAEPSRPCEASGPSGAQRAAGRLTPAAKPSAHTSARRCEPRTGRCPARATASAAAHRVVVIFEIGSGTGIDLGAGRGDRCGDVLEQPHVEVVRRNLEHAHVRRHFVDGCGDQARPFGSSPRSSMSL